MNDIVGAINAAVVGSIVTIPPGVYTVPIDTIEPPTGVTIILKEVTLRIEANDKTGYYVIRIKNSGVTIIGGRLIGDRAGHLGATGEWGHGISIKDGAKGIKIDGTRSSDMWGDGFYIGGGENVTLTNIESDNNRRQGLSIVEGKEILVTNSIFRNTEGTPPESGLDIEPDRDTTGVQNVVVTGCRLLNNAGSGLIINAKKSPVHNIIVKNCVFHGNHHTIKSTEFNWLEETLWKIGLYNPTSITVK